MFVDERAVTRRLRAESQEIYRWPSASAGDDEHNRYTRSDYGDGLYGDSEYSTTRCAMFNTFDEATLYRQRDIVVQVILHTCDARSRIVDLGCGDGVVLAELRQHGLRVVGIDCSAEMLFRARQRLRRQGLTEDGLIIGDVRRTQFSDASIDAVICLDVLGQLEHYAEALDEISRLLRPGGTAIIGFRNVFNPVLSDPLNLVRYVGGGSLRMLLSPLKRAQNESFDPDQRLDHRKFVRAIALREMHLVENYAIGIGPWRFFGQTPLSPQRSIRLSRWLEEHLDASAAGRSMLRWFGDVSLWVYRKPIEAEIL